MNRRGKNHYGTLACGPDYDEGRPVAASGILVRAIRPRDARPLAREEGHRRVRAGRRLSERVEDRQLLHATEQMAADGTGGDPPRRWTRRRPRWRSLGSAAWRTCIRPVCGGCRGGWGPSTPSSCWATTSASRATCPTFDGSCASFEASPERAG